MDLIKDYNITIADGKTYYTDIVTGKKCEKDFTLTLENLRKQFIKINYEKEYQRIKKIKDPIIEKYKMPQFAFVYYYYLVKNMQIPTPMELVDFYLDLFCIKLENNKYTFKEEVLYVDENIVFEKNALAGRVFRAYNSYNREIEFMLNLTKMLDGQASIKYDLVEDLYNGIDLIVKYKDKKFGIATYVGTKESLNYKQKKNTNRHDYSKINMIDVVAILNGEEKNVIKLGDVLAYKNNVVKDVAEKIIK